MANVKQTAGAILVGRMEDWLMSYMAMDRDYALVVALWAFNTWIFKVFDATPYLCVTANVKQSGKTRLLELTAMLSRAGKVLSDPTPPTLFRLLESYDGWMTILYDEAERLNGAASGTLRAFMNSGYRKGQTLPRVMPGGEVRGFPVYCPKAFALIGDVNDTLRDRSIVLTLSRGTPLRKYRFADAERESVALVIEMEKVRKLIKDCPIVEPTWLGGRDEEIWTPIISVAHALGLDKTTIERVERASADLTAAKTVEARRYSSLQHAEADAIDTSYGERLIVNLMDVLGEHETAIFSAMAVERLRAIPTAPWRTFKGSGLTTDMLADLLSPFGVTPKAVRMDRKVRSQKRGYSAAAIRKAVAGLVTLPTLTEDV